MQMQGEEVRGRKCCERFCGETSADGMNALACVVLTVLTLSAASASDVRDPVRLVENTNYYATLPGGALEQHQYAFVAAAATAYNVRITRHEPFADRMNAQRLCVSPNSSSSPAPLCIPFVRVEDGDTEDEEDSGATIGLYSVTVVAPAAGTAYAVTVASTGGGFSYTVRYCRGQCTPQCTADCSGHGGCPAAGLWCACDAGYRGRDCAARRSPGSEDDSSDWLGPLLARLLAALVWGFLALVGAALLAALVAALLVCCGAATAASLCACCCAGACCAGTAAAAAPHATHGTVHSAPAERQPLVVSVVPADPAASAVPAPPPPPYPSYPSDPSFPLYPDTAAVIPPAV